MLESDFKYVFKLEVQVQAHVKELLLYIASDL
jgi:hypothetical protein